MTRRVLLLCAIVHGASIGAQQDAPDGRAFVEIETDRDRYFVQQEIRLRLRVGIDEQFVANNLIQPFRQPLDVPARIEARWLDDLPDAIEVGAGEPGAGGGRLSVVLNDGLAEAVQVAGVVRDGRRFTVLEVERRYLPERAGELAIPAAVLRFDYATRFSEDFLGGRVAEDPQQAAVRGEGRTLRIEPLPDAGRPPEFRGAVGRFTIGAEAEPRDVAVGESFKLVLRIEGRGNLRFVELGPLDGLGGFHVFGRIDDASDAGRTVTVDLAPLSEAATEVPAIGFAFFDPEPPAGYRRLRTEPIPLVVRPLPEGARPPAGVAPPVVEPSGPGVDDIFDIRRAPLRAGVVPGRSVSAGLLAVVLLAPWLLALGLAFWLRVRARRLADPDGVRARGAAAVFRARATRPDAELASAFAEFLAARMRCSTAAVISPALPARLEAAGVPAELAARAAGSLDSLVAVRFGGGAPADGVSTVSELVERLEGAFRASGTET